MRSPVNSNEVQANQSPTTLEGSQHPLTRWREFGRSVLQATLQATLVAGAIGLLLILASCWAAPYSYHGDLLTNFRAQYFGFGAGLIVLAIGFRQWRWGLVLLLLTTPHAFQVLPYYWPPVWLTSRLDSRVASEPTTPSPTTPSPMTLHRETLRLVSFNVLYLNQDREESIRFLRSTNADLIVLCECMDGWFEAVQGGLADTHPFNSTDLFPLWGGTQIFSRQPLSAATDLPAFRAIPAAEKLLAVATRWQDETIILMGVHPASPINQQRFHSRNEMLNLIAQVGGQVQEPLIIAGDFNCTSGSPYFLRDARLRDSRRGFGWQGSWPTFAPAFLRIPIDHVFINEHWEVLHREIGPAVGSDHSPVITELRRVSDAGVSTSDR